MKLNKIFSLSGALLAAGALASAQSVSLHGYMDYTNFAAAQNFSQAGSEADWEHTDCFAEFGSFYNGRSEVNANVTAANFEFNIGVRLDAAGNSWYNLYHDVTQLNEDEDGYANTAVHQMNMKIGFLNDQLLVYTGRFEEWNAGYVFNGYAMGGQPILELASRDAGQYFTGVEYVPYAVPGLRVLAGLPIIPVAGNSVQTTYAGNNWKNLYKKVKFVASYNWLRPNVRFNVGFRPGTYYTGIYAYDSADGATTNYFMEGFLQADMPTLVPYVKLNATYDFRGRTNDTVGKFTTAHFLGISGQVDPMILPSGLNIFFENRTAYADDHYVATNEKLLWDALAVNTSYALNGTPYSVGFNVIGRYAQDANGTSYAGGDGQYSNQGSWCADYDMTTDWITAAASAGSGSTGRYWSVYGYPYFQKGFQNGYFQVGVELQYTHFHVTDTTQKFAYRVPVKFCFWF